MVGRPDIFESKRYGGIAIRTERSDERCFDLVILFDRYLVIAGVTVEEGEEFIADDGVYHLIYPRQNEGVFRAVFVEINVINAHSPFFILFLNKNWVCQPLNMIHFFNKSC